MFVDSDENRKVDQGELIVRTQPLVTGTDYQSRASERDYIRYKPTGIPIEYGSIIVCPPDGDSRYASRLVVSSRGRPKRARDNDGDGVVENRDGSPVSFPPQ